MNALSNSEICKEFSSGKIICGVKDPEFEILLIKPQRWLYVLVALSTLILGLGLMNTTLFIGLVKIKVIIAMLLIIGITLYLYFNSEQIYFSNNRLIVESKIGKRKIIDISNYPRIYSKYCQNIFYHNQRQSLAESYYLHIQKNDIDVELDMDSVGYKKINLLLNNFILNQTDENIKNKWNEAASEKEKNYTSYIEFLNKQEKIIGVKENFKKIKILNGINFKKRFLISTLAILVVLYIESIITRTISNEIERMEVSGVFIFMAVIFFLYDLYLFIRMFDIGMDNYLKISYLSNDAIRINKYLLKYKKNDVMIYIKRCQLLESKEKYNYQLIISGKLNEYIINLNLKNEKDLGRIIDNFIFKPKDR